MEWTPAIGASELRKHHPELVDLLCAILSGGYSAHELASDPTMIPILHGIGGSHALNLLKDPSGERLAHWPRVWSARTLAIVGNATCAQALKVGSEDSEWRVRMQSVRAAGIVADPETVDQIAAARSRDAHPRVRAAAALSIGRVGSMHSMAWLSELSEDSVLPVRQAADRAIAALQARYD